MQTFLPYADFTKSLSCLDNKRLGKQRVEAAQIIKILSGEAKKTKSGKVGWINHPAVRQWNGYADALKLYFNTSVKLWVDRGMKNTYELFYIPSDCLKMPVWLGHEQFHKSHRSNLLRKDFSFYSQYGWEEDSNLPYFWPSQHPALFGAKNAI
jgi:hypothetical protein